MKIARPVIFEIGETLGIEGGDVLEPAIASLETGVGVLQPTADRLDLSHWPAAP